jgi:hypothetical protein
MSLTEALVRLRHWLTLRRVLHIIAILLILATIKELAAVSDVTFLLGFDWGLALEVGGAMMLLAARTHVIATADLLRHRLSALKRRAVILMRRGVARAGRSRPQAPPPSSSDDDGPWVGAWSPVTT